MNQAQRSLTRLRDEDDSALTGLAHLAVQQWMDLPLRDLPIWPRDIPALHDAIARSLDDARAEILGLASRAIDAGTEEPRTPRSLIAEEAWSPIRLVAGHPLALSESLIFEVIDQGVVHRLLAEILESALRRFLRKARHVDDRIKKVDERLGGFGRRARGLFGGVAQEIANAVGDELEHSVERRIKDFVKQATSEMLRVAARRIADPSQAEAWASFRLAVLDVVVDLPISEWSAQAREQDPEALLSQVLDEVIVAVQSPAVHAQVEDLMEAVLARVGQRSARELLPADSPVASWVAASATPAMRQIVATRDFEQWWMELHREG